MQFFGDVPERGWITEPNLIPYEGPELFEKHCQEMIAKNKKDKQRYTMTCSAKRRAAWQIAVDSADIALPMTRNERKQTFTFIYDPPKPPKEKKKPASPAAVVPNGQPTDKRKNTKRKKTASQDLEDQDDDDDFEPPKKRRKKKSVANNDPSNFNMHPEVDQYLVFCQKKRDLLRREHPSYDERQIEVCLEEIWAGMSSTERAKYDPLAVQDDDTETSVECTEQGKEQGHVVGGILVPEHSKVWYLLLNTVECRYNAVQYNMMLHALLQWKIRNVNQSLRTQKAPHIWS